MASSFPKVVTSIRFKDLFAAAFAFALSSQSAAVDFGAVPGTGERLDVVALARSQSEGNGPYKIYCSGVVIHPQVVLTAAHCLQEGSARPGGKELKKFVSSLRVHFGQGHASGFVSENLVQIRRAAIHPNYMRGIRGWSDIAVLILKSPAPIPEEQIRPLALDFEIFKTHLMPAHFLTVAGFGFSEDVGTGTESFGLKRSGETRIEGKTANEIQIVSGRTLSGPDEAPAPRDGDSGGPVYLRGTDGRESLVGIVSRATKHNNGNYGSALSLIRPSICWIENETGFELKPKMELNYCKIRSPIFQPNAVHETDFRSLCLRSKNWPLSFQFTISVLKKKFNETDCSRLQAKISETTNLSLDAAFITDISPLAAFSSLERLSIRDNGIQSVSPIRALPRLRYLDLSYNNVKDLETLNEAETRGLKIIGQDRQKTNVVRTEFLRICLDPKAPPSAKATVAAILQMFEFKEDQCINANYEIIRLRSLDFYQVEGLTDMRPLMGLTTLEALDLTGQKTTNIEFLRTLPNLRTLVLDGNPISDLSPIRSLPQIRDLSLHGSGIVEISPLSGLSRLKRLNIQENRIIDFSSLKDQERRGLEILGKESQQPANM